MRSDMPNFMIQSSSWNYLRSRPLLSITPIHEQHAPVGRELLKTIAPEKQYKNLTAKVKFYMAPHYGGSQN
jgi:hypothetical protein